MLNGTYDPAKFLLSFFALPISGYAKGTFIEVEREDDGFAARAGTTGEVTRTKSNNRIGMVTVTLEASSSSNDLLMAIALRDDRNGDQTGPLFGKELNGTTAFAAAEAWIKKIPKIERGDEAGTVQWVIACADLEIFIGGLRS